jgi:MoxR-like ATPase
MTKGVRNAWKVFEKLSSAIDKEGICPFHRILLYGKPGTGKTTTAIKTANSNEGYYSVTLNEDSTVAELFGMWMPKGPGEFAFVPGVGIRAWLEGTLLVINEIDHAAGSVMTILHALLDDKEIASLTIPIGHGEFTTVRPHKMFRAIATMNGKPEDLDEALADRFDIKLEILEPHPDAIAKLPEDLRTLAKNAYSSHNRNITYREIVAYSKLREVIGRDEALFVFGELRNDVKSALAIST